MIDSWQALILALIQGLSEFLPISSSAHLVLPSQLLGWPDQGLAFDVAVHFGSLLAVMFYFRTDIARVVVGGFGSLVGRWNDDAQLAWMLVLATIPAGLAGLIFDDFIEANLRTTDVIAITTIAGGLLLLAADRNGGGSKTLADLTWGLVLLIGLAQVLALVPGTSRSGITITMALFLGLARTEAARFSFLMSVPIILLSAVWMSKDLIGEVEVVWSIFAIGIVASGLSAYACIAAFIAVLDKIGMLPFVVYRVILGLCLLLVF